MADEAEEVAADIDAEEVAQPDEPGIEEPEAPEDKDVVPKKQYNDVFARAKKAEEELKKLKSSKDEPLNSNLQADELKLIARGLSDEEIEQAKIIAKGKDIKLTEAIKDPMFIAYQKDVKEQERKEKAKLGASRGSSETEPEITGLEPGSTRDAHKAAFDKIVGKPN